MYLTTSDNLWGWRNGYLLDHDKISEIYIKVMPILVYKQNIHVRIGR